MKAFPQTQIEMTMYWNCNAKRERIKVQTMIGISSDVLRSDLNYGRCVCNFSYIKKCRHRHSHFYRYGEVSKYRQCEGRAHTTMLERLTEVLRESRSILPYCKLLSLKFLRVLQEN